MHHDRTLRYIERPAAVSRIHHPVLLTLTCSRPGDNAKMWTCPQVDTKLGATCEGVRGP